MVLKLMNDKTTFERKWGEWGKKSPITPFVYIRETPTAADTVKILSAFLL